MFSVCLKYIFRPRKHAVMKLTTWLTQAQPSIVTILVPKIKCSQKSAILSQSAIHHCDVLQRELQQLLKEP